MRRRSTPSLTATHPKAAARCRFFSGASLFLPAAGYCNDGDCNDAGDYGNYWSRSLNSDNPDNAWNLNFEDGDYDMNNNNRCNGQSVRPVRVVPE